MPPDQFSLDGLEEGLDGGHHAVAPVPSLEGGRGDPPPDRNRRGGNGPEPICQDGTNATIPDSVSPANRIWMSHSGSISAVRLAR